MVGTGRPPTPEDADTVAVLETNLDDIAPELIGFAIEGCSEAGRAGRVRGADPDEEEPPRRCC